VLLRPAKSFSDYPLVPDAATPEAGVVAGSAVTIRREEIHRGGSKKTTKPNAGHRLARRLLVRAITTQYPQLHGISRKMGVYAEEVVR
jgi:hypothetical protein